MTTAYDFPEAGLYFDAGCRTATELDMAVIEMARAYGWDNVEELSDEDEFLNEVADDAIDYLNSLETREGVAWGYGENSEGFGLWQSTEE
jgi:hypothetical protein